MPSAANAKEQAAVLAELAEVVGYPLLIKIARAVCAGRRAYPLFAVSQREAADVVESEFLEWKSQAMLVTAADGSLCERRIARSEEEGSHVLATMARYVNREYGE